MIQALMLLRSKKQIDQAKVLSLFFFLFRCRDKNLRSQLYLHIVSDVKAANSKGKNHKLNKSLQQYMYSLIVPDDTPTNVINATESSGDATDICAKYSLDVCIELYRRNVWNDSKTVNIIAEACLSPYPKVLVAALKFFLGTDRSNEESDEEQDEDGNNSYFI